MSETLLRAQSWLDEGRDVVLATVVETWGSAPVPVGGHLIIDGAGEFAGSVSGGCVEAEVIARAPDIIASGNPELLEFGVDNETAWGVGLACGGRIRVYAERLCKEEKILKALLEAHKERRAQVLVMPLSGRGQELIAEGGFANDHFFVKDLSECFLTGRSKIVEGENGEVFLQTFLPAPRLMIVGATHIAQTLVRLAIEMGFEPFVIDPRTAFATKERFGETKIITQWPGEAFGKIKLDRRSALVCLAHVPDIDDEALCAALESECFYIGALGSRRSHAKRLERLKAKGFSAEKMGLIHGPIGLDIGSLSPEEIALSIIAEVVKTLRAPGRE